MDNVRPIYNGKMGHMEFNINRSRVERFIRSNIHENRQAKKHVRDNTWSHYFMIKTEWNWQYNRINIIGKHRA